MTTRQSTMSASQVVKAIADRTGMTPKDVKKILAAEAEVVHEALCKGEAVAILNGGAKALIKDVAARTVRNPSTGESFNKPAGRAIKIKPLSALKSLVA